MLDDLHRNFIPLGVLLLADLPKLPGPGMPAPDHWDWFDYTLLDLPETKRMAVAPEVLALQSLVDSLHVRLTYKIFHLGSVPLLCLRVYHTLMDFDGCSILTKLRPNSSQATRIKAIRCLLSTMDFSPQAWDCNFPNGGSIIPMFETRNQASTPTLDLFLERNNSISSPSPDNAKSRLLEIYRGLDSPNLKRDHMDPETEYLISLIEGGSIPGLKTQLYKYQVRSVCKMLQVEMSPDFAMLPTTVPITSVINNRRYYVDPINYTFCTDPSMYAAPRGGVLAEDMGLGKSLICIALTIASKAQCSRCPEDVYEGETNSEPKQDKPCSTLSSYCVESVMKNNISWRMYADWLPRSCVKKLQDSPGYYYTRSKFMNRALKHAEVTQSQFTARTSNRSIKNQYSTDLECPKIWLSCATLIICPSTLFDQWRYEIIKHADQSIVSTLCLSNSKFTTPSPQELLNYDIILMSVPRLAIEEKDKDSPLKFVHWKRLVIDEGHSVTKTKSRLSYLARELHAERRWAVSGTPTPGLTRMSVETTDESSSIALQFSEKQELEKLGSIMENFLMVEPWTTYRGMWHRVIVKPFLTNAPRSDTRVQHVLEQLVVRHRESDVRLDVVLPPLHRKTVFLEPSFHNKVALNLFASFINVNAVTSEREDQDYLFNPLNRSDLKRLMNNLQVASFYWSGFSSKDLQSLYDIAGLYLKKMEAVKEALAGNSQEDLAKVIGTSKRLTIMTEAERTQDEDLLRLSMQTVDFARHDKQWTSISKSHEMCYYTDTLPAAIYTKSNHRNPIILNQVYSSDVRNKVLMVGGSQLVDYKQKLGFYDKDPELTARLKLGADSNHQTSEAVAPMPDPNTPLSKSTPTSKGKPANKRKAANKTKKGKEQVNGNVNSTNLDMTGIIPKVSKFYQDSTNLDTIMLEEEFTPSRSQSPFTGALGANECDPETCQLLGTGSSKLSYLIARLLVLSATEKSIVFYEFDDIAFYIAEALDIIGIKYLIYANTVSPVVRSRYLAEFHINSDFRVLLMNVRLASHGLDVSTASRVFFVSPIWRNDVEAQAIKRAHRIGQRFPVFVETLVLRGTMEEAVLSRRRQQEQQRGQEQQQQFDSNQEEMSENEAIHQFLATHPYLDQGFDNTQVSLVFPKRDQTDPKIYPFKKHDPSDQAKNFVSATSMAAAEANLQGLKTALRTVSASSSKRTNSTDQDQDQSTVESKRVKFA